MLRSIRRAWLRLLVDIRRQQYLEALENDRITRRMREQYRRRGY